MTLKMDRSYTPRERILFYKFITARNEWDELRQIAKELGWDKNKIRQFNRIRAYWENKPSQKRQGGKTAYMDELINEYFKKKGFLPETISFGKEDVLQDAEERYSSEDWDDIRKYGEGSIFYEDEGGLKSAFAEIVINEDGTLDLMVGDSNPAES